MSFMRTELATFGAFMGLPRVIVALWRDGA